MIPYQSTSERCREARDLRKLASPSRLALLLILANSWVSGVETVNFRNKLIAETTLLPSLDEVLWRSRCLTLKTVTDDALGRVGQRGEKIWRCSVRRSLEAKVLKVLACKLNWAKVDLAAFIQNGDFIEFLGSGWLTEIKPR